MWYDDFMKNEEDKLNALSPIGNRIGDKNADQSIGGVAYKGKNYGGLICTLTTKKYEKQLHEVVSILKREYFSSEEDKAELKSVSSQASNLVIIRKLQEDISLLVVNSELLIPNTTDVVKWYDQVQDIFPDEGKYIKSQASEETISHINYVLGLVDAVNPHNTIASKAAFIFNRIAGSQYFPNANKRMATLIMLIFLRINGYDFSYYNGLKKILVKASLKIGIEEDSVKNSEAFLNTIVEYIKYHCQINTNNNGWSLLQNLESENPIRLTDREEAEIKEKSLSAILNDDNVKRLLGDLND